MEELKEKELPETAEAESYTEEPEITEAPEQPEEPELTQAPEPGQKQGFRRWLRQRDRLWLGVTVGAVSMAMVAAAVIGILLMRWPEPQAEAVTVYETVYVPVEVTEPTLPPPEANPLEPEDFTYDENGFMTCTARPSVLGIDISTHQKEVDWEQVKAAGVEFAMLRAAYRGYGNGAVLEDEMLRTHYAGAKAAGVKVGFYFFSQAITPREARDEARFLLEVIEGFQVDMPIVFDWEYIHEQARTAGVTPRILTDCAIAFCERIKEAGYEPMIYFNANQSRRDMYLRELTDYKFWLAMYSDEMTYEYQIDMWQYTQFGRVPGIPGDVDINLYFPEN